MTILYSEIIANFASEKNIKAMGEGEINIQELARSQQISVDYFDEDIVIIDNLKQVAEANTARIKMNVIAFCSQGKAQFTTNGEQTLLAKNQMLIGPPHVVFSDIMMSPDFEFKMLFFTNRILQSFLREKISIWHEVLYIYKQRVVSLTNEDGLFLTHFYEMLRQCVEKRSIPYRQEMVQSLLRCGILGLCGLLKGTMPALDMERKPVAEGLFQRFLNLVGSTKSKHQKVEYYATQLFVSPKYLSIICKKNSGKTANDWINEYVMEDIRYYMKHTDMSIKQVADLLGFSNPSFFGKYVKIHFGMTPLQLRRGNGA